MLQSPAWIQLKARSAGLVFLLKQGSSGWNRQILPLLVYYIFLVLFVNVVVSCHCKMGMPNPCLRVPILKYSTTDFHLLSRRKQVGSDIGGPHIYRVKGPWIVEIL